MCMLLIGLGKVSQLISEYYKKRAKKASMGELYFKLAKQYGSAFVRFDDIKAEFEQSN